MYLIILYTQAWAQGKEKKNTPEVKILGNYLRGSGEAATPRS